MVTRFLIFLSLLVAFARPGAAMTPQFLEEWKDFRARFLYHIQIVGLGNPVENQHRLLLITEPPPGATLEGIRRLMQDVVPDIDTARHGIGYDGWVKDILVDLPPMSEQDLALLVDRLHQYLFGTSYKASAVLISDSTVHPPAHYKLNLQVPASTLATWLLSTSRPSTGIGRTAMLTFLLGLLVFTVAILSTPARARKWVVVVTIIVAVVAIPVAIKRSQPPPLQRFVPIEGGAARELRAILQKQSSGVFESESSGLVVWSLPRSQPLSAYAIEARQFALDADLILGAVASPQQVAIIARERTAPVSVLPPLRTETLLLLAGAETDELAQSYERTNSLAGKYDLSENLDWAPAYLSPQLIDTEYGSLLNIADQLLKSWSERGEIRYVNFNYPEPDGWPFPEALSRYAKTGELTFNWNTKGAGYSVNDGNFEIFALNRTGALPVDYLGSSNQQLLKAEDDAYDYFNNRNDPNLVRVVQYAAMYQIFRRFGVKAPGAAQIHLPVSASLKRYNQELVAALSSLTDSRVAQLSDQFRKRADISPANAPIADQLIHELQELRRDREILADFTQEFGNAGVAALADNLAAPRESLWVSSELAERLQGAHSKEEREQLLQQAGGQERMALEAHWLASELSTHSFLLQEIAKIPLKNAMAGFVSDMSRPEIGWIRTPSVVVSQPTGSVVHTVGGHNLSADITLFRKSNDLKAGEVKVVEENQRKVVLYSPQDFARIGELARPAGREAGNKKESDVAKDLQSRLRAAKSIESRPLNDVLAYQKRGKVSARGLDESLDGDPVKATGYRPAAAATPADVNSLLSLMSPQGQAAIVVERLQDSGQYRIFHNTTQRVFEANDVVGAQDAVIACMRRAAADGSGVHLHLRGLNAMQGEGFAESAKIKLGDVRLRDITTTIDDMRLNASDFRELLNNNYDFKNARIEDVELLVEEGVGQFAQIKAEVSSPSRPSLLLRIRIFFAERFPFTAELAAEIRSKVRDFIAKLGDIHDSIRMYRASSAFLRDMGIEHPGLRLQMHLSRQPQTKEKISTETRDIYIVHNEGMTLDRAACNDAAA